MYFRQQFKASGLSTQAEPASGIVLLSKLELETSQRESGQSHCDDPKALVESLSLKILISHTDECQNAHRGMSLHGPPGAQGLRGMGTREAQNLFNSGAFSKKRMQCHIQGLGRGSWPPGALGPPPRRLWLGGRDRHRRAGRPSAFLLCGADRAAQGGFISRLCVGPVYSLPTMLSMSQLNLCG